MELKDIQRELPEFKEKIDLVGVKNICAPIRIKDRANKVQNTVAKIEMSVCLSHHQRGTHMSRFTEQLHLSERTLSYKTLKKTLEDLQKILHADSSFIIVRFPYFIKK
ncbi:GTP cyclohydrolase I FolE2, partial [Candidatus Calescamantes bacterium]|nr:GTP cyclohydrolase I FolE2 [Candidatus Calescamantes bacterium]